MSDKKRRKTAVKVVKASEPSEPSFQAICTARYLELVSLQDRMQALLNPSPTEREVIRAAIAPIAKTPSPDADYEEHA